MEPPSPLRTAVTPIAGLVPYDFYILALSTFAIVVLAADSLPSLTPAVHEVLGYTDTALCALFFLDFVRSFARAPRRWQYFVRSGWLDLASSIPAVDALRLARLIRMARILRLLRVMRSARTIGQILSRHRKESALSAAAVVSIVMVVFGSIAVLQFEHVPEANIRTGGDALWWSFATVTTAGYGDRYPVTLEGRVVAALLMAVGIGLFGTISGLVASWFLHPDSQAETDQLTILTAEVARLAALVEGRTAGGEPKRQWS